MNIITNYNIDNIFNKIKIKKPIYFNNKIILNLYYEKNEYILFQTPIMYLPYDYIYDNNIIQYIDLCEYNILEYDKKYNTKNIDKFLKFLNKIFKKLLLKIDNYDNSLLKNKDYLSSIINNDKIKSDKSKILRIKNNYLNNIKVYDNNNNLININQIIKESKIKCILAIKNIWIYNNKYGINIQLLQIQNKNFINNYNLFSTIKNNIINDTHYINDNDIDNEKCKIIYKIFILNL